MWTRNIGPCECYYCQTGKPHREHPNKGGATWLLRGHLQVSESLHEEDMKYTRTCWLCTHEIELNSGGQFHLQHMRPADRQVFFKTGVPVRFW